MLRVCTGENRILANALVRAVGAALAGGDEVQYIVVPRQMTLFTERLLLEGMRLSGSFRLQVLNPARLCTKIFDAAGMPDGERVDEQGRVMLVRQAIRAAGELAIYRDADRRRGFSERCARQLELFIQGGVTPEDLRACAEESQGAARLKLRDLAAIMEAYEALLENRFRDGDVELKEAAVRTPRANFVREGRFWFFGFDIMPQTLMNLIAQVASACLEATLYLPLANDKGARDYDCYRPLESALGRIQAACGSAGVEFARECLTADAPDGCLHALARELYAYPVEPWKGKIEGVRLAIARDVREECMLAAAEARRLAMGGMRYGDIRVICADMANYHRPLGEAFAIFGIPLFQEGSRPLSHMATAECLLTALRLVDKGFRSEDVFALMRCGYMRLERDEADRLANYAVRYGIDGARWLRPLKRGTDAEIAEMEPIRARLMEPLQNLRAALRDARELKGQLTALFNFLTEIDAYNQSLELQRRFDALDMREASGALSQSWNRIIGAMDQMAELMGEKKLPLRELNQALTESLEATQLKPLPQSGDAVCAQSAERILMEPARALIVIGLSDAGGSAEDGLLTQGQRRDLAKRTRAYLGPDETETARLKRFHIKTALGMASELVWFSCALSGLDGSARRPGLTVELIKGILPELKALDEGEKRMLLANAPRAALGRAARALSERRAGRLPDTCDLAALHTVRAATDVEKVGDRLRRMDEVLLSEEGRESLDPASARELYGKLQAQSITSLELFAKCPFSYFAKYGLAPDRVEPFDFDRREEGRFLHDAVRDFLNENKEELNAMTPEDAEARMNRIVDELLRTKQTGSPMEDSASVRAESRMLRAVACRCAQVLAAQMEGSSFHAAELEYDFGKQRGDQKFAAGDTALRGRIDRLDLGPGGERLRIIDFKRSAHKLNLAGVYHGLELQLLVYLGAAMQQFNAGSAGVYYFKMDDGVVSTQSTDPNEVKKARAADFRMSGLLPADIELIRIQAPEPKNVFAGITASNALDGRAARADDRDFARLVNYVLGRSEDHVARIRSGVAQISPTEFDGYRACTLCDYGAACLFDSKLDAKRVRRLEKLDWKEVIKQIALADEDGE